MMYKIQSNPSLEIENLDEIGNLFRSGESLSFEFPIKYKRRFKRHVDRLNKCELLRRKSRPLAGRIRYVFYLTYIEILELFLVKGQVELKHALWIYFTFMKYIASYEGVDLDDQFVRVTFSGREHPGDTA